MNEKVWGEKNIAQRTFTAVWTAPELSAGGPAVIQVLSVDEDTGTVYSSSLTVPIVGCEKQGTTTEHEESTELIAPQRKLQQTPLSDCKPSSVLGYSCYADGYTGVYGLSLHYQVGGSAPDNECTSTLANKTLSGPDVAHFAVRYNSTEASDKLSYASPPGGWLALAFPATAGVMFPADTLVGYQEQGAPVLQEWALTAAEAPSDTQSWARDTGLFGNSTIWTLCFSRKLREAGAANSVALDVSQGARTNVNMAIAVENRTWPYQHSYTDYVVIDLSQAVHDNAPVAMPPPPPSSPPPAATPPPVAPESCEASPYPGFACATALPGVRGSVHWTIGGPVPATLCSAAATNTADVAADVSVVHVMAVAQPKEGNQGWIGVSFPDEEGKMFPADAVIAYIDILGGNTRKVQTYALTRYGVAAGDATAVGFVLNGSQAVVFNSASNELMLCFSRARRSSSANGMVGPTLSLTQDWALNVATGSITPSGSNVVSKHTQRSAASISPLDAVSPFASASPPPEAESPPPQAGSPPPTGNSPPSTGDFPPPNADFPPPEADFPPPKAAFPPPNSQPPPPEDHSGHGDHTDGACPPSSLGYDCSAPLGNAVLHYTINGTAPDNACTRGEASVTGNNENVAHMALQARTTGYVALAFAGRAGSMYPADMVVGWVNEDGSASVGPYYAGSQNTPRRVTGLTWGTAYGVVQLTDSSGASTTVVCVSRNASEPNAAATSQLLLTPESLLDLNYAIGLNGQRALVQHAYGNYGSGGVELGGNGTVQAQNSSSNTGTLVVAHGALMAAAWALVAPVGVLAARHKWAFGKNWFNAHRGLQALAISLFIAGVAIAFSQFPRLTSPVGAAHFGLGIAITVLVGLQLIGGLVRPKPDAGRLRAAWSLAHFNSGRITLLAALANVGMGIYLAVTMFGNSVTAWAVPVCVSVGLVLLADVALTLARRRSGGSGGQGGEDKALSKSSDVPVMAGTLGPSPELLEKRVSDGMVSAEERL